MELYQLKYLVAIARSNSISGAARDLGVSQSTLSAAVSRLEQECGTTLFLRTRDGVRATETGALLVERASALLASVDRTLEEVREIETEARGRFVVGCHDSLGSYFLPELLQTLAAKMPSVELQIWNGSSMDVRDAVLRREVHFGLVVNTLPHLDLVIVNCFEDEILVMGLGPPPADLEMAEAVLRAGPLVWPSRAPFDDVVRRLAARNLVSARRIPVGDLGLARSLGCAGVGPVVLPRRVAELGTPPGQTPQLVGLHPELPAFRDQIHLVFRADLHRTRAGARVREEILARGRALDLQHGYRTT
jgi:DNA-binding transcriptional LysR family regulator